MCTNPYMLVAASGVHKTQLAKAVKMAQKEAICTRRIGRHISRTSRKSRWAVMSILPGLPGSLPGFKQIVL